MSRTDDFTAIRQFEMDSREQNYEALVEESKKRHEEEARQELDAKMVRSLADYQTWPSWTVEDTDVPSIHRHTLTMKIVFKP